MNEMINATRQPVVFTKDGEVFANSRDVAEAFDKNHRDVLASIDNLLKSLDAEKSAAGIRIFSLALFSDPTQPGRRFRSFDMNRDGFTLLAMGFTGAKALKWKLRYIDNLIASEPDLGLHNFVQTPYVEPSTGQTYRSFDMDRRAFSVPAMGFTGAKAERPAGRTLRPLVDFIHHGKRDNGLAAILDAGNVRAGDLHKGGVRDIKIMLDQLGMSEEGYVQNWTNPQNGQSYPDYTLLKDLTLTLIAGYNVVFRKRIIDRRQEVEEDGCVV